jgi:hypothetical protein
MNECYSGPIKGSAVQTDYICDWRQLAYKATWAPGLSRVVYGLCVLACLTRCMGTAVSCFLGVDARGWRLLACNDDLSMGPMYVRIMHGFVQMMSTCLAASQLHYGTGGYHNFPLGIMCVVLAP